MRPAPMIVGDDGAIIRCELVGADAEQLPQGSDQPDVEPAGAALGGG